MSDAPVRHWVRRYYHQDDGNGFGAGVSGWKSTLLKDEPIFVTR